MKKRITAVMLCCLCLISTTQAFAAGNFQPLWTNVRTVSLAMSYSGGQVHWEGQITGYYNTASISATYTLEKQNANGSSYTFVDSWTSSTSSSSLYSGNAKTTPVGTYRLSVSAAVTMTSGSTETVTDSLVRTFS